ncbi:sulfotransferase family protein [Ferrimonas balearica]|uniref:sulfotransferase family 2 domain-containing protein n=1 Tax=Ferrimonas balearica TaxID=44012 RepID=UPI001C9842C7|nr:sulfotransferase family 2 domain-containing protein [Ferrimonas balearica]MBY6105281.1 sulfotransferase family protein [Ferrimonas balearica]
MIYWKFKRKLNLAYFSFVKKQFPNYVKERDILYIHIPKAGGISICKELYGREIGHKRAIDYKRADGYRFETIKKFSIVRNPYSRLISAYNFLRGGGIEKYRFDTEFSKFINTFPSFEEFVYKWLSQGGNKYNYIHFIPQADFLFDGDKLLVDKIGKLEDLDRFICDLNVEWNVSLSIDKHNESKSKEYSLADLKKNTHLMNTIYSIYKDDFARFEYDREIQ